MPNFIIRNACSEDLPALEWEGEYRIFRRLYRRAMNEAKRGHRILLVADLIGRLIGQIFIQLHTISADPKKLPKTGYFYSFRVRSEYRNLGVGTSLVSSAEDALRRGNFQRALIGVAKDNSDALRLYERLGYRIISEDPGEWSFIDDENEVRKIVEPTFILEKYL
ncbi:MAG: GNAT family N-acetyltransferase [Anaerolineales bacterium]|nr:GNAT family N-acetyltransferase [Anaerolineales bacterium]